MVNINEKFKKISPIRIQRALNGLSYPATKQSVMRFVKRKIPDNAVYLRIRELPPKLYKNETEILESLNFSQSSIKKPKKRQVPEAMIVPKNLSLSANTLLVVLGKQHMDVYTTKGRDLRLIHSFKVPRIKYSDTEGHFKIRDKQRDVRSGMPREIPRNVIPNEFLREASSYFKTLQDDTFSHVILFVPAYIKNDIISVLSTPLKQKITKIFEGNFRKSHPKTLLIKIKESTPKPQIPASKEAKKILNKAKLARKIIKGKP